MHHLVGDAERVAEAGGDLLELQHLLGVGLLVGAVEGGDAPAFEEASDGFVGRQHELFDQAVGDVALAAGDADHLAALVEADDGLGQVEVNRAAPLALGVEDER